MQNWPEDIVYLVLRQLLPGRDGPEDDDDTGIPGCITASRIAISCRALRSIAQPVLYERVHLDRYYRADELKGLLVINPRLVMSTKYLIIGNNRSDTFWQDELEYDDPRRDTRYIAELQFIKELLEHFRNIRHLQVSRVRIEAIDMLSHCLREMGPVHILIVDRCGFLDICSMTTFMDEFPNLDMCTLEYILLEGVHTDDGGPDHPGVGVEHLVQSAKPAVYTALEYLPRPRSLLHLSLLPSFRYGTQDSTLLVSKALIAADRTDGLESLTFDLAPDRISAFELLLRHSAQTLSNLTVTGTGGWLFNIDALPQLRSVHLPRISNFDYTKTASLLVSIIGAAGPVHPHVKLGLPFGESLLEPYAAPIWEAIEAGVNIPEFILEIEQMALDGETITEEAIRNVAPCTNARGALTINITIYPPSREPSVASVRSQPSSPERVPTPPSGHVNLVLPS